MIDLMSKLFNVVCLFLHLILSAEKGDLLLLICFKFFLHCLVFCLFILESHHELVLFTHVCLKALNVLAL